jgi:suppressor of G2 allele of SKP1
VFISFKIKKGDIRQSLEVCYGENTLDLSNLGVRLAKLKLANQIVPHLCNYTCGLKKIEIKLKKAIENFNWVVLESATGQITGVGVPMQAPTVSSVPAYPSSSKSKKNWDKIDTVCEKELKSDKPEGDAALNDLFKQIYGRADEATRRAMIKSY